MLYKVTVISSFIIRQFLIPNPFSCFGDRAYLINWLAEPFMHLITYLVVGFFYEKGTLPVLGSVLYLITYLVLMGVLSILSILSFAWWWCVITIVTLIILIGSLVLFKNYLRDK